MFRVQLTMKKIEGYPSNFVHNKTVETWDEAEHEAMSSACFAGTLHVSVYDEGENMVAVYNRLDNYWHPFIFLDEFIPADDYFAKIKNEAIRGAKAQGFNIDAVEENGLYRIIAGKHSVLLEKTMIPWISNVCDDVIIYDVGDIDEDLQIGDTPDEWFEFFAQRLQDQVDKALSRYPEIESPLRG